MKRRSKLSGINRRDFLSGVAIAGIAAGLSPLAAMQDGLVSSDGVWTYPPQRTGLRGTHPGSFEPAHAIAWAGEKFEAPRYTTDNPYDLIVVGGGISGLATAFFARKKLGNKARILILDNHDDFGGHAKRNEFDVKGRRLIGYGGSQSIDTPSAYSKEAATFLKELTIETDRFYRHFDRSLFDRLKLSNGLHLDAPTFGEDKLLSRTNKSAYGGFWTWEGDEQRNELEVVLASLPLSQTDKTLLHRMLIKYENWLKPGDKDQTEYLLTTSYENCLKDAGLSELGRKLLRNDMQGLWGLGWDGVSGMEAIRLLHPTTYGLGVKPEETSETYGEEPYIFHFPDGNAAIARLAVAKMIPDAVTGDDMDSIVKAKVYYDRLDLPQNSVRLRLNSIVVDARNTEEGTEVTYIRDGKTERVTARNTVMACWNNILPFIMPEMPASQKEALAYPQKTPLGYINVALNSQKAFFEAGVASIYSPGALAANWSLDFPVSMGGYVFPSSPDDPAIVHMTHCPTRPGLPAREQHRLGRMDMLGTSFEDYEEAILSQMQGALGAAGFDAERDIAAITVNRWPHGYAYEYNELFDPADWSPEKGPHIAGRAKIGNIAIANSDSSAYAYVNGAVDAAARAIGVLYD
jgi:spermidine dehydrogenase